MAKQRSLAEVIGEYREILGEYKKEITGKVGEITDSVLNAVNPNLVSGYKQLVDRLYENARQGLHVLANTLDNIAKGLENPYEKGEEMKEETQKVKYKDILSYMREHKYKGMDGFNKTLDELNIKGRVAQGFKLAFIRHNMPRKKRK